MERNSSCVLTNMCMVEDEIGRVLVQQRVDKNWSGIAFPGGHVEPGESLTESVIREVKEETGLTIKNVKLCGVKDWCFENNSKRYIVFLYKTSDFCGELIPKSNEGKNFWVSKEELESKLNLQFWIISNGEYGSEVKIDYLRLEYSKNWIELIAIGTIAILSVIAICVNLNKNS